MTEQEQARDPAELISRVLETAAGMDGSVFEAAGADELAGFRARMDERSGRDRAIVLAEDTAVELGAPGKASQNAVLWTRDPEKVTDGRVTLIGPDLQDLAGESKDYAQVVMLTIEPEAEADLFKLESAQYLTRLLPGVMARMVPGRLWLRTSRDAVSTGLGFALIASAMRESLLKTGGVSGVQMLFVTRDREAVEAFSGAAAEAGILAGRHKKIMLGADGDYECEELNCESCDEKPVCDRIREVVTIRRREKRAQGKRGGPG